MILDPTDTQRLEEQDLIGQDYGAWPMPPQQHRGEPAEYNANLVPVAHCITKIDIDNDGLARYLAGLRTAVLLPLSDEFNEQLRGWLAIYEDEAIRRLRERDLREVGIRRAKANGTYQAWEDADLVAEVEMIIGPLQKRGREYVGRCPFHEDRTPSLRVNAEKKTWHCFPCARGGGVVAWRKAIEGAA